MQDQIVCVTVLTLVSFSYGFAAAKLERVRLAVAGRSGINLLNTWVLAGAVTLPAFLLLPFVAVLHWAVWPAHRAVGTKPGPYRLSSAASMVASGAASLAVSGPVRWWLLPIAAVIFCSVNLILVAVKVLADREFGQLRMFLVLADHLAEFGTAGLGVVLGVCMLWSPILGVLGAPLLLGVHRTALRDLIRRTRSYDPVTGLHSERLWRAKALETVNRGKYAAIIMVDPRGSAERQIPRIIQGCLRPTDPIGRYDGGWFVAVTKATTECGGSLMGDRVAAALERAGVDSAVGVCCKRDWGLPEMVMAAAAVVMASRADLDSSSAA